MAEIKDKKTSKEPPDSSSLSVCASTQKMIDRGRELEVDTVFDRAVGGEFILKFLYIFAKYQRTGIEHPPYRGFDLFFLLMILF